MGTCEIKGKRWKSAYLPVWLYCYEDSKHNEKHYIAVNGRTKETMGSVPFSENKFEAYVLVPLTIAFGLIAWFGSGISHKSKAADATLCIITLIVISLLVTSFVLLGKGKFPMSKETYNNYRNPQARHTYEKDTKIKVNNLKQTDTIFKIT